MRVRAIGAYFMKGTSKKSGQPYDMAKLVILAPVDMSASPTMQTGGYGYKANELDMVPEAISKFGFTFPHEGLELDLEIDSIVRFGRLQSVIVGAKKVVPVQSVKPAA